MVNQHSQPPAASPARPARATVIPITHRDRQEPLPHAAVRSFRDDGFLVVPSLCDTNELIEIRDILMALFQQQAGRKEGNQFDMLGQDQEDGELLQPQLIKPSLYAPALQRTEYFERVRAIARQLLGSDAEFSFDHSIIKPAGKIAATPWHQDEAHRDDPNSDCQQISFWMPLQEVNEDNGCMRYVPGSHRGGLLPHRSPSDDPRIHALECLPEYVDESAVRAQPVLAGWCILHAGRTLHAASPNYSAADRLAYIISFRGQPVARREKTPYAWLEEKRTPAKERHLRWRRRGGFLVLLVRRLSRLTDVRSLRRRAAGFARRLRAKLA